MAFGFFPLLNRLSGFGALVIFAIPLALFAQGTPEMGDSEFEQAVERFYQASSEQRREMEGSFKAMVEGRKKEITESYNRQIEEIQNEKRGAVAEAIKALETFLTRHPNHPKYTPEVMLRLAELYYDAAQDAYARAFLEYSEKVELYNRGKIAELPPEPTKDYSKALGVLERLVQNFPDFSKIDAALYAMGSCYVDIGDEKKAEEAFRQLIKLRPDSEWAPRAWVLLGDTLFWAGKYSEAVGAYEQALNAKDADTYIKALYMYGWAHFQKFDYPNAIKLFKRLLTEIDEWQRQGTVDDPSAKKRRELGMQIRKEIIGYLGVSLADEDWDGDGVVDTDFSVGRALGYLNEGKPFENEVLERFADTLFETHLEQKQRMAIEAYNALIAKDPLNPKNASIKEKVVGVYDDLRDQANAIKERLDLVKRFGPGSPWYEANKKNPEVVAKVDKQVEMALEGAAGYHHMQAREFMKESKTTGDPKFGAKALESYRTAAQLYREYLDRYPHTKEAYKLTAYLAECLYYAFQYEDAAKIYEKVRDWEGETEFLELAAYSVIDSIEKECAKRVKDGVLDAKDIPGEITEVKEVAGGQEGEGIKTVTPKPIPPLTEWWIKAIDAYLAKGIKPEKEPDLPARLAYRAAYEYYRYLHLEEARKRFEEIIDKFPDSIVASYASLNIINSYKMVNDWANVQLWAKKIEEKGLGKAEERAKLQEEVRIFQLGAQFKEAEKLFDSGDYVKAAETFVALVDKDPKNKFADQALQNAAVAYQKARRYDSAYRVYERIATEYPQSQYVEGALIQMAETGKKFFDFEKAIRSYDLLRKRFPNSKSAPYAFYITGYLLEAEGRSEEAARTMEEFAKTYPNDPEAPTTLLRASKIYQKMGRDAEAIRTINAFVSRYGKDAKWSEAVVEALARVAEMHYARGNKTEFERAARTVIKEFEARHLEPGKPVAGYPAKYQFTLTEPLFKEYEGIKLTGSLPEQGRKIQRKKELLKKLEEEYAKVVVYQVHEWTTAAFYRLAKIHELFADALYQADVPQMAEEEMDVYRQQLEEASAGYLETAQKRYKEMIENARRLKISTEWVNKAREAMNKYSPQDFPLFKEERRVVETQMWHVPPYEEEL
jgi:TolA-binding protein